MFGDISAWMFEYLAGIKPDMENPGFKSFAVKPAYDLLDSVNAAHESPYGAIKVQWSKNTSGKLSGSVEIPAGTAALVYLPDGSSTQVCGGKVDF